MENLVYYLAYWILPTTIGLSLGSFFNVIAYRLSYASLIKPMRSFCPSCKTTLKWFDLFPVFSWLWLRGKCRYCRNQISVLYPFIEILTAAIFVALAHKFDLISAETGSVFITNLPVFLLHLLFFAAIIICVRTDIESMVVLQLFTLWVVPVGLIAAYFGFLEISFRESIIGALAGYFVLFAVAKVFKLFTKKDGLGIGDMEMLAMIGAFLGPIGVWITLMAGSIIGSAFGIAYLAITRKGKNTRIPFGPFLAMGAVIFFFFKDLIIEKLLF